nr:GDSL-type esterase/lipase family protein [Turicibacter sanguinis]
MGDSIVEAFTAYDYLDPSSVVAKVGLRLATAEEEVQKVIRLSPDEVFLLFGANDLLVYKTADQYIERYEALIQEMKQALPHLKVYIVSIFPIREDIAKNIPELSLERVTVFNEALKTLCEVSDYRFLDVASYVREDMYEPDGIHVKSTFYPIWMQVIKAYKEAEPK